jgi:hypothetical protein
MVMDVVIKCIRLQEWAISKGERERKMKEVFFVFVNEREKCFAF